MDFPAAPDGGGAVWGARGCWGGGTALGGAQTDTGGPTALGSAQSGGPTALGGPGPSRAESLQECLLPPGHRALERERLERASLHRGRPIYTTGKRWPKEYKKHESVRERLNGQHPEDPVPSLEEWLVSSRNEWMDALPPREADVLCLHAHALKLLNRQRPTDTGGPTALGGAQTEGLEFHNSGFCWDIGWSIGFAQKKNPGEQHLMSCQLRSHRQWYQGAQNGGRYLLGLETLYAHGFGRDFKWSLDCPGVAPRDLALAEELMARGCPSVPAKRRAHRMAPVSKGWAARAADAEGEEGEGGLPLSGAHEGAAAAGDEAAEPAEPAAEGGIPMLPPPEPIGPPAVLGPPEPPGPPAESGEIASAKGEVTAQGEGREARALGLKLGGARGGCKARGTAARAKGGAKGEGKARGTAARSGIGPIRMRLRGKCPPPATPAAMNCERTACGRPRYGPSPFCCASCRDGRPHCRSCGRPPTPPCCMEAALFGHVSHSRDCTVSGKRDRGRRAWKTRKRKQGQKTGGGLKSNKKRHVDNASIQSASGNTMSPPVVGSFMMLALAATTPFAGNALERDTAETLATEQNQSTSAAGFDQVGPLSSPFGGTPLDRLYAGLGGGARGARGAPSAADGELDVPTALSEGPTALGGPSTRARGLAAPAASGFYVHRPGLRSW